MESESTNSKKFNQVSSFVRKFVPFEWIAPLFLILLVLILIPIGKVFEYNFDEGFELMRAFLQNQGFLLYKDIWSDQPPFFSQILRIWLAIFGNSIFYARFLILLLAVSLLYFFYRTVALFFDKITALFGAVLLIFTQYFIPFSVQVKVDMPALSLGMASIFCFLNGFTHSHKKAGFYYIIASAVLLILAIETKLYVILLVGVLGLYGILKYIQNYKDKELRTARFKIMLTWGVTLAVFGGLTGLGFYLWLGDSIFELLVKSHLSAADDFTMNLQGLIQNSFKSDPSFWLLSASGLLFLFSKERERIFFPVLWFFVTMALFSKHSPVWPHYYLLLAMPMAWVSSASFFWIKEQLKSPHFWDFQSLFSQKGMTFLSLMTNRILTFLGMALIGMVLFSLILLNLKTLVRGQHPFQAVDDPIKAEVLANVKHFSNQTNWIATDRGIFAFYSNLKLPPEFAVLSRKRVLAQGFDGADFLDIIKKYQAEQVLLGRFVQGRFEKPFLDDPSLANYLQENYVDITIDGQKENQVIRHYVLRSLKK